MRCTSIRVPLVGDGLVRIIANLPYNVGTALLTGWLTGEAWPPWWASLTLMFQREVAERIVADESDPKDYGRLGVLCGWRTESRILFDVPPSAFVPPPKVTSSVVHLTPRADPCPAASTPWKPSPAPPSGSAARCCARASNPSLPIRPGSSRRPASTRRSVRKMSPSKAMWRWPMHGMPLAAFRTELATVSLSS